MPYDTYTPLEGASEDPYSVRRILAEVLEKRTGSQMWFIIEPIEFNRSESARKVTKIIRGYDELACKLWEAFANLPEIRVLRLIEEAGDTRPQFSDCKDWDDQTQRRLLALYWSLKADKLPHYLTIYSRDAHNQMHAALLNTVEAVCHSCPNVHKHDLGPAVSLPLPEDLQEIIEDVVDKYLVPLLRAVEKTLET